MNFWAETAKELFSNKVLINALAAWLAAQVIKFFIYFIVNKEIRFERFFGDGGMPSGHSATVTAMAVTSLQVYGIGSFEFAVSAVLAVIIMNDATGVRFEAGKHAQAINEITELLNALAGDDEALKEQKLKELIGHTPFQVFCGMMLGLAVALLLR